MCPIVFSLVEKLKGEGALGATMKSVTFSERGVTFEQRPEYNVRGRHAILWKKSISLEVTAKIKSLPRKGTWHISRTQRLE